MCLQIKYVLSRLVLTHLPPKNGCTQRQPYEHSHKQMTHIRKNHNAKSTGLLSKRGMWPVISAQESREGYMLLSEKAEGGRQHRRKKWNEMIKHVFPWRKSGWDCRVIPQLGRMCACACVHSSMGWCVLLWIWLHVYLSYVHVGECVHYMKLVVGPELSGYYWVEG